MSEQNKFSGLGFVTAWDLEQMEKDCRRALSVIFQCEEKDLMDNNFE